jgi:hypothetical protein
MNYGVDNRGQYGALEVHTDFFFMAWILFLITPVIEINGQRYPRPWGRHRFDLPPGQYTVRAWFPYFFMEYCGSATVVATVYPGQLTRVAYHAPFFIFSSGDMSVVGTQPIMQLPAAPYGGQYGR